MCFQLHILIADALPADTHIDLPIYIAGEKPDLLFGQKQFHISKFNRQVASHTDDGYCDKNHLWYGSNPVIVLQVIDQAIPDTETLPLMSSNPAIMRTIAYISPPGRA